MEHKVRDAQTRPFSLGTRTRVSDFLQVYVRAKQIEKTNDDIKTGLQQLKKPKEEYVSWC